jgi:hypothetical protein
LKPHLFKRGGVWVCKIGRRAWWGMTLSEAYTRYAFSVAGVPVAREII